MDKEDEKKEDCARKVSSFTTTQWSVVLAAGAQDSAEEKNTRMLGERPERSRSQNRTVG